MSSLVATKIELFLFDVHVFLSALEEDVELLKPSFRFLVDPDEYDRFYKIGSALEVGGSTFRPLTNLEISTNHFWRNFGKRFRPLGPWLRHLPLIYEFSEKIDIVLDNSPIRANALAKALLWPWGWSCELTCSLDGILDVEDLSRLIRCLKSGNTEPGIFVVAGVQLKCNKVFQKISEELKQQIFSDGVDCEDSREVDRHFVLSILETQGKAQPYEWSPSLGWARLSTGDRAELHSVLLGRTVSAEEVAKREQSKPRPFLLTTFCGAAFGLTDFDNGTVFYLPRPISGGEEKDPIAKHCLGANNGRCSQTALALSGLLENSDTDNLKVLDLTRSAQGNLERLARGASNNFIKGFVRQNTRISKFLGN